MTEAGFPPRVVHAASRYNIPTVRALRQAERHRLHGIGHQSEAAIVRFLDLMDHIARGTASFAGLDELLSFFLAPNQLEILVMRFGLRTAAPSSKPRTLQEIGNVRRLTRERVRQVEACALGALRTRLAQACLDPVYAAAGTYLAARGGAVDPDELESAQLAEGMEGFQPAGILRLLCECRAAPVFRHGFFTQAPATVLDAAEVTLFSLLDRTPLMDADAIAAALEESTPTRDLTRRTLDLLLARHPDLIRLRDGRYGRFQVPGPALNLMVREIFGRLTTPVHFRAVLAELNTLLKPGSRLGTGHMLELLAANPDIERRASGYYGVRPVAPVTGATP